MAMSERKRGRPRTLPVEGADRRAVLAEREKQRRQRNLAEELAPVTNGKTLTQIYHLSLRADLDAPTRRKLRRLVDARVKAGEQVVYG